jgi:hypothetical protein
MARYSQIKLLFNLYPGPLCPGGRAEDIAVAAKILKGRKVSKGTRFVVVPASKQVYMDALTQGDVATLVQAGATFITPGCAACLGSTPRMKVKAVINTARNRWVAPSTAASRMDAPKDHGRYHQAPGKSHRNADIAGSNPIEPLVEPAKGTPPGGRHPAEHGCAQGRAQGQRIDGREEHGV